MATKKKTPTVKQDDEAALAAIRQALDGDDPRTAGLTEQLAKGYVDLLDGLPFGEGASTASPSANCLRKILSMRKLRRNAISRPATALC